MMKAVRSKSQKYQLVPVLGRDDDPLAPVAFMPALPVRLKNAQDVQLYAPIDTRAAVGRIQAEVAERLKLRIVRRGSHGAIAQTRLVICDANFQPWIELRDVPFRLTPPGSKDESDVEVVLGFNACLSNLRLTINYRSRTMTVSAPPRLRVERSRELRAPVSERLQEGEQLISIGSYSAAIAMLTAGLEEVVARHLALAGDDLGKRNVFVRAREVLARQAASTKLSEYLATVMKWRNRAVHGSESDRPTERDARLTKSYVRQLARWFDAHSFQNEE